MPSCLRIAFSALGACLFSACFFATRSGVGPESSSPADSIRIAPDLSIGNEWMYRCRQFTEYQDGTTGDTLGYFIHYRITGDSSIGGRTYRILEEEDLALFNTDDGLLKNRSTYAVEADSEVIRINTLKEGRQGLGRFPFKIAAVSAFDSLHFRDQVLSLSLPFHAGSDWAYREPGHPAGLPAATKIFLGRDTLPYAGKPTPALRFRIEVENLEYFRMYEWYSGDVKILSRFSSAATFQGLDSSRSEQEYLGKRYFTREDTLSILKGTILEPTAE